MVYPTDAGIVSPRRGPVKANAAEERLAAAFVWMERSDTVDSKRAEHGECITSIV